MKIFKTTTIYLDIINTKIFNIITTTLELILTKIVKIFKVIEISLDIIVT